MKTVTLVMVAIIPILFLYFILRRTKNSYEVQLFVQNASGEILLVFDQHSGRFVVPHRQVAFDEIPTKVIHTMMTDLFGTSPWDFDYSYHFSDNKYDRIRDDTGPIYAYDVKEGRRKRCVLCYLLRLTEYHDNYDFKKEYPYPEFYTRVEIDQMGKDINPNERTRSILHRIMNQ